MSIIQKGYYVNDKKQGFGIYIWANPSRAYIGFWFDGKQEGVGKYISPNKTKYGYWQNGERKKWYKSEREAINDLSIDQLKYIKLFENNIESVNEFLLE